MKNRFIIPFHLSCFWMACAVLQAENQNFDQQQFLKDFDEMAVKAMGSEKIPGMAIGVVKDDKVIYLKGFGVKKEGESDKVDTDTVFHLASTSKPITGTVVAAAVDHGFLKWDDKVKTYVPNFKMKNDWVTEEFMIKDALSHRSGLRPFSGDELEAIGYNLNEIIERLKYLEPISSFRSQYAYQNSIITIGGLAAANAAKKDFNEMAKELLFKPLEMNSSSYYFVDYNNAKNKSYGHVKDENGKWVVRYTRHPDVQFGGGGVSSSAHDVSNWLIMYLNEGKFKGKQVISEKNLKEAHTPQILVGEKDGSSSWLISYSNNGIGKKESLDKNIEGVDRLRIIIDEKEGDAKFYAMGINVVYDYNDGYRLFQHNGAFSTGIRSMIYMLPEEKFGIVVLSNAFPSGIPEGLCFGGSVLYRTGDKNKAMDMYVNYNQGFIEAMSTLLEDPSKKDLGRAPEPSLALEKYAGTYKSDFYDSLEIKKTNSGIEGYIGKYHVKLDIKHYDGNVFSYKFKDINGEEFSGLLTFKTGENGGVIGAEMTGFDASEFKKVN
jgi:CubicO group peptidase (beta-lactamase class C family)